MSTPTMQAPPTMAKMTSPSCQLSREKNTAETSILGRKTTRLRSGPQPGRKRAPSSPHKGAESLACQRRHPPLSECAEMSPEAPLAGLVGCLLRATCTHEVDPSQPIDAVVAESLLYG